MHFYKTRNTVILFIPMTRFLTQKTWFRNWNSRDKSCANGHLDFSICRNFTKSWNLILAKCIYLMVCYWCNVSFCVSDNNQKSYSQFSWERRDFMWCFFNTWKGVGRGWGEYKRRTLEEAHYLISIWCVATLETN